MVSSQIKKWAGQLPSNPVSDAQVLNLGGLILPFTIVVSVVIVCLILFACEKLVARIKSNKSKQKLDLYDNHPKINSRSVQTKKRSYHIRTHRSLHKIKMA